LLLIKYEYGKFLTLSIEYIYIYIYIYTLCFFSYLSWYRSHHIFVPLKLLKYSQLINLINFMQLYSNDVY